MTEHNTKCKIIQINDIIGFRSATCILNMYPVFNLACFPHFHFFLSWRPEIKYKVYQEEKYFYFVLNDTLGKYNLSCVMNKKKSLINTLNELAEEAVEENSRKHNSSSICSLTNFCSQRRISSWNWVSSLTLLVNMNKTLIHSLSWQRSEGKLSVCLQAIN